MIGLLLLKHIHNQKDKPFDPTEFIHFRKRIGESGAEKLLKISVYLFGAEAEEKEVLIDSTIQEKNITYLTDVRLHKRIIEKILTQQRGDKKSLQYL